MAKAVTVKETLNRAAQLTQELKSLRAELCSEVFASEGPSHLPCNSTETVEVITQFKAMLDDIRHVVWLYLETLDERPLPRLDPQRRLLDRATEILGVVAKRPPLPTLSASERSFVDRLLHLIEKVDPKPPATNEIARHRRF